MNWPQPSETHTLATLVFRRPVPYERPNSSITGCLDNGGYSPCPQRRKCVYVNYGILERNTVIYEQYIIYECLTRGLITFPSTGCSISTSSVKGSWTDEKSLPRIGSWILWEYSNCILNDLDVEEDEKTLLQPPLSIALMFPDPEAAVI